MLDFAFFRRFVMYAIGIVCFDALASSLLGEAPKEASRDIPLYERMDALVEREAIGSFASICSDTDFLRRITLDLTGAIPTAEQVRKFLDDSSPLKRSNVIEQLVMSEEFARHMAVVFDVMFLERRSDKSITVRDWESYLIDSIASNKPLDQLFQELIFAEGDESSARVPTKFILNRDAEPNAVTRDIGRIAFGMDMQCAQCHDHPLVSDYLQEDYYGLYAYWHRTRLFTEPKSKALMLSEVADGQASFKSVFTGNSNDHALPRPPKGPVLIDEPILVGDQAYVVAPAKDKPGKPKFSRRQSLSKSLTSNPQFRRNLANRLWLIMFGRGIVHPIDLHHTDNPPINPALLQLLAEELTKEKFQLRPIIRELAMTRAYQRSCEEPNPDTVNFRDIGARKALFALEQEQATANVALLASKSKDAKTAYDAMLRRHGNAIVQIPVLTKKVEEAEKKWKEISKLVDADAKSAESLRKQSLSVGEVAQSSAKALKDLPTDPVVKEVAEKLNAHAADLSSKYDLAVKKQAESNDNKKSRELELAKAKSALQAMMQEKVQRETFEPIEQAYISATLVYENAVYELKAIEQKLKVCQLAEDFESSRKTDPEKAEAAWQSLVEAWTHRNQIAALKPLTPEQLAISTMRATGTLVSRIDTARQKLKKSPPAALKNAAEAEKGMMERRLMQGMLIDELRGTIGQFVGLYGGLFGEDFQATVNQALFFGNSKLVDGLLKPTNDNLIQRMSMIDDPTQIADELYLAILSRPASEIERTEVGTMLSNAGDQKTELICELSWALLSSNEFRFNH
jgi:hypothetical protein